MIKIKFDSFSILTLLISYLIGHSMYKCIERGNIHAKTIDVSKESNPILFWFIILLGGLACLYLITISFVKVNEKNTPPPPT